jgi:hypothetical protein
VVIFVTNARLNIGPINNQSRNKADEEDESGDEKDEGSEMGEHSRESDATSGPGRLGIGNLPCHPSESISGLCGTDEGDQCPGAIAD